LVWVLAFSALLAGCAQLGASKKKKSCPPVSALGEAATLTKFIPNGGPDLAAAVYQAKVVNISRKCIHDRNKAGYGYITMKADIMMQVERGLANRDGLAAFVYFVSVADTSRRILSKESFPIDTVFPAGKNRVDIKDGPVTLKIPIKGGQTFRDFEVFVGFQLTRKELEYNRRLADSLR